MESNLGDGIPVKKKLGSHIIYPVGRIWDHRSKKDEAFDHPIISHLQYGRLKNIYLNMDGELLGDLMNPNIPWIMKAIMTGKFVVRRRYLKQGSSFGTRSLR